MSFDRLQLLEVRLGSGRVYLVPRAVLLNLIQALPVSAPQLIISASQSGGPLAPSGLPSQIDEDRGSTVLKPYEPRHPGKANVTRRDRGGREARQGAAERDRREDGSEDGRK